jgi:hypothetical protein
MSDPQHFAVLRVIVYNTFCCIYVKVFVRRLELLSSGLFPSAGTLKRRCTRFMYACSALCKCKNWLCRTCTPHHTVAGRSSVSLTQSSFAFPSNCRCGPPLTSYMPGRSIPCTRARHSSTRHRTLWAVHGLCTSALKEQNVSETRSVSILGRKAGDTPTQLGGLERDNVYQRDQPF